MSEHKRAVKNNANSSELAKNLSACDNSIVDWASAVVVQKEKDCYRRLMKESLIFAKHDNYFSNMTVGLGVHVRALLNS